MFVMFLLFDRRIRI